MKADLLSSNPTECLSTVDDAVCFFFSLSLFVSISVSFFISLYPSLYLARLPRLKPLTANDAKCILRGLFDETLDFKIGDKIDRFRLRSTTSLFSIKWHFIEIILENSHSKMSSFECEYTMTTKTKTINRISKSQK